MGDAANSRVSVECLAVLLDIEGTVAPVTFVYDVMFPFVREQLGLFLESRWTDDQVQAAVALLAADLGLPEDTAWPPPGTPQQQRQAVSEAVIGLMDRDAKVTGLKQLQGLIWKDGFHQGRLVSELFPDVLPALQRWRSDGIRLYIYSSGSIAAQQLFFGHTTGGDLRNLFSGYFDTTSGSKKQTASYAGIARQIGQTAGSICFISDVPAELDAARAAGLQTLWRPSEVADAATGGHQRIDSFAQLHVAQPGN
jgi:enolase-phosphatase E1